MDEQTRKAMELARDALQMIGDVPCPLLAYEWLVESQILSERGKAIAAIDDALAAPAAPVARADGMPASAAERLLRRLLAVRVAIPGTYYDDGEAHGTEHGIWIDFMRDPAVDLAAKLQMLNEARAKTVAPAAPVAQANQVKALENIRDDCVPDDLTPGEYACAVLNGYYAAPADPASLPVSEPAGRWTGDDAIESPHNAGQHRGYCLSLKAAPRARLTDDQMHKALNECAESIDHFNIVMTHWPLVARAIERAHGIGHDEE